MALRAALDSEEAAQAVAEVRDLFPWPLCTLADAMEQRGSTGLEAWLAEQDSWYWTEALQSLRRVRFSPPAPNLPVVLEQLAKLDQARDEHMGRETGVWFGPKPASEVADESSMPIAHEEQDEYEREFLQFLRDHFTFVGDHRVML
jgi:hypothetical protein